MTVKKYLAFLVITVVFISCGSKKDVTESDSKTDTKDESLATDDGKTSVLEGILLAQIENVEPASEPKIAPNFSWTFEGKESSLNEIADDNLVFLNFWATWCGPCIKEMPELSEIAEDLKNENFKLIGLNVFQQPGAQDVVDFLKERPVSYLNIDANEELVIAFGNADGNELNAIPTSFIIKNGKIVETIEGIRSKAQFMELINKHI